MRATNPKPWACRLTSDTLSLDSGTPKVEGSSHANALISTVSCGGKNPGASRAGSLFETRQSFLEKPLAPLTDDLAPRIEACGDLVVSDPAGRHQNHFGAHHLKIRQRIFCRTSV
jgi:hypothetical protein